MVTIRCTTNMQDQMRNICDQTRFRSTLVCLMPLYAVRFFLDLQLRIFVPQLSDIDKSCMLFFILFFRGGGVGRVLFLILLFNKDVYAQKDQADRCIAKCRYLIKLTCKGTLRQVFYLSEAPFPPMTPHTPPPLTHCICLYSVLIPPGPGGGGES